MRPAVAAEVQPSNEVLERPDKMAALITARVTGKRVKITGMTSESEEYVALPDGQIETTVHAGAVRMRRDNGWVPIDLTLERKADGSIAAKAHPNDLKIKGAAGAGDHDLASIVMGGERVALGWKGALPEPVLDGNKATYNNALPGVDLVLESTRSGVEQFFVVKNPGAALQMAKLTVPLRSVSLKIAADATGGIELRNKAGQLVGTVPAPEMWDANVDPTYGWHTRRKAISMSRTTRSASVSDLVLSPDMSWITDPATSWPVTIDPTLNSVKPTFDTYVREDYTTDRSGATDLQLGKAGTSGIARSFLNWNTSALAGSRVTSATVYFFSFWSNSCTAREWQAWTTSAASTASRFATPNQPSWNSKDSWTSNTKGFSSSCDDGWVSTSASAFFNRAATAGQNTATMGLRAGSETDVDYFKQFRSAQATNTAEVPYANITYDAGATTSNLATVPATACTTGASRPVINTASPVLKATVTDPEGGAVGADFEWWNTGGTKISGATNGVASPSGTSLSVTTDTFNNGTYSWRVRGVEGDDIANRREGLWSQWCEFTVDTSAPSAPSITSSTHPTQTGWYPATTFAGTISASDPNGIAGYAVKVDGAATTAAGTTVTQTSTAISLASQPEGVRYVHVAAKDAAGNWSGTTHYKFNVDTTKPGAPAGLASSTHPVDTVYYPAQTATVNWSAPSDLAGIGSYAIKVDQTATTIPATTDNVQAGTDTDFASAVTNGTWWIHVRAKDNAGNWSDTAAHIKINVDSAQPLDPAISSDTHTDQNAAYTTTTGHLSWVASTATGFSVQVDQQSNSTPDTIVDQTSNELTITPGDGTWYVHVRAKGSTGNWTVATHFRLTVDTTAPMKPAAASVDFPADTWSDKLNQAGAFTFQPGGSSDVTRFRYQLDGGSTVDITVNAGQNGTAEIVPATDGPHTLTVWSLDKAGNISPAASYRFFIGAAAGKLTGPVTGDITAAKTVLRATGHVSTSTATYEWRRADTDAWTTIPAGDVTFTSGGGGVTWPVGSTGNGAYPDLNWDVAKTINDTETGSDPLDGPLQIRAAFGGNSFGPSSMQKITFDKNLASATSAEVGPGAVNLITGNYSVSGSDVSAGGLAVGRTYNTRQASKPDPMFGPGWTSSVVVAEGSAPYTKLEVFDSLLQVGLPDGSVLGFTATGDGTTFEPPVGSEEITVAYNAATDKYTVLDTTGNKVVFGRKTTDPAGQYHPDTVTAAGSSTSAALSWEKVTVGGVELVRPTKVIAAAPSGVTCSGTLVRGCQALNFSYATATTGTASVWGDYSGRIKEISYTAWNPATSAVVTVVAARYGYDNNGRLRAQWDPRLDWNDGTLHHLQSGFTYNVDGILTTVIPAGQEPWQLVFTTVPADSGKGRLYQLNRSALTAGTNITTVVYRVPVSGAGAPYDLSPGQTIRWEQDKAPTDATAIFPATQVPGGDPAAGILPGSYERATVSYVDANARLTNTAIPGGGIDAIWYDQHGNTVRELTAGGRQHTLDQAADDTLSKEQQNSRFESSWYYYSADGQRLQSRYTAGHEIVRLDGAIGGARRMVEYTYDQGAPATGGPYELVTSETAWAYYYDEANSTWTRGPRTIKTEYDWSLQQPIKSIVDPDGLALTSRASYDSTGRKISETTPTGGSSDTTPATRGTVYYTAATNSSYPQCGNRPEWDGLVCLTKPGGQPASGPELPITTTTYNLYGQPATVTESTSGGTLRTTTNSFDAAGRVYESTMVASGLGEPIAKRRNIYGQTSAQNVRTQTIDGNGIVTAEIVRGYDTLGQLISYQDADGNVATYTYDLLGRPVIIDDGKATRRYAYDEGSERRGLPTSVTDSNVGKFTGTYDIDGNLVTQTWPNGVVITTTHNRMGETVGLTYTQPGCGQADCTLYTETVKPDAYGQQAQRLSTLSNQTFGYDNTGRLTKVTDTVGGQCASRVHTYDSATNRTGITAFGPSETGACQTTAAAGTTAWTFDTAARSTGTGYTYDTLGRTRTMPGSDSANINGGQVSLGYHVNDMARTISQAGKTNTYTLDVITNRFRSWTDGTITKINHYAGDGDNPTWTDEGDGTYTRAVSGLSGIAAQHTANAGENWTLTNLHGDFIATMPETGFGLANTSEYDENGKPRNAADVGKRYGWMGDAQRAADTPGGLTLMGARLYAPGSGRFLTNDPVYGGNSNPYEYCSGDAINCRDTTGLWGIGSTLNGFCFPKGLERHWYWNYDVQHMRCYISHKFVTQMIDGVGVARDIAALLAVFWAGLGGLAAAGIVTAIGAIPAFAVAGVWTAVAGFATAVQSTAKWLYQWCGAQHGIWVAIGIRLKKGTRRLHRSTPLYLNGVGCRQ